MMFMVKRRKLAQPSVKKIKNVILGSNVNDRYSSFLSDKDMVSAANGIEEISDILGKKDIGYMQRKKESDIN